MNKKNTGSYYTPEYLARFITDRVFNSIGNEIEVSVLEPSAGDGAFISELANKTDILIKLYATDINEHELQIAKNKWNRKSASFIHTDFLNFEPKQKFSLVIGNPPYVKKNLMSQEQIDICNEIHQTEFSSTTTIKNIWTSFVIKASKLLKKDGILAYVLPSELLQVKFAEEIREFLKKNFERIEIFTFNDLMFDCKGPVSYTHLRAHETN
jgi:adenine-specific DNA-methyltransferase